MTSTISLNLFHSNISNAEAYFINIAFYLPNYLNVINNNNNACSSFNLTLIDSTAYLQVNFF